MNNQPPNQPWGQQPGDQPTQQAPQQWGQQQPGGQQPYGQQPDQWGGQQPPGQWGAAGPAGGGEPPKKKTGLIIGIVVAVLVLIGGGVAAAIVLTGDDDDDKKSDDDTSQTSDPTDEPTDDPTDEPTDEPTDDPTETDTTTPSGDSISGQGYTYSMPDGWLDASDDASVASAPSIDTVIAWGSQLQGSRANMIVETQSSGGASSPEDLKDTWVQTMTTATGGATPEDIDSITVDGQETIGVRFERSQGGVDIVQVAHLMISGDTAYAITLSFQPKDESEVMSTFDEIVSSWSFD